MKLTLVRSVQEAKGTKTFVFESNKKFSWLPGQFLYLTLPKLKYPDQRGQTRHFTISSSPTEGLISITTRIRESSGFKKTLNEIKTGEVLEGEGPNGTFILDESEKGEHILIAGGIGITPYRSFIKYNIDKQISEVTLHLIYSNSLAEETTFHSELEIWSKKHDNIHVDMTVTQPLGSKTEWTGHKGRIDANYISEVAKNYNKPKFWISGPPTLVDAMEKVLRDLKIPSHRIISEKFTGY